MGLVLRTREAQCKKEQSFYVLFTLKLANGLNGAIYKNHGILAIFKLYMKKQHIDVLGTHKFIRF